VRLSWQLHSRTRQRGEKEFATPLRVLQELHLVAPSPIFLAGGDSMSGGDGGSSVRVGRDMIPLTRAATTG
jgi:hypothetical protein